jgi:hypothetical protein
MSVCAALLFSIVPHQVLDYADAAVDSLFSPVSDRMPLVDRVQAVVASVWAPVFCAPDG